MYIAGGECDSCFLPVPEDSSSTARTGGRSPLDAVGKVGAFSARLSGGAKRGVLANTSLSRDTAFGDLTFYGFSQAGSPDCGLRRPFSAARLLLAAVTGRASFIKQTK